MSKVAEKSISLPNPKNYTKAQRKRRLYEIKKYEKEMEQLVGKAQIKEWNK